MEVLGDLLEPYSDEIAKFAGSITCLQFLSGVFLMNDIRKKGSSDAYPPDPFIGGVVLTILSLKLGTLMGDEAMIKVNVIGFAINVVFMVIFYWYASGPFKSKIWSKIGIASTFTMACLAYSNFEDPAKIEFRFGMLITAILVILVGMPLLSLGEIIEKKSTEGLPFPLILSGTIVAAAWAAYGISIRNDVVTYQNLFLLLLSSIQLSLFAIYPNNPSSASPKEKDSPPYSKLQSDSPSKSKTNKKRD
ncbi:sugar transporter SWEET1 [Stomoxys calcitrans]|uniref:Sugar transporter SWEET n=1 Tax=Stomoxys calcitrans TaxID=35570 RepID=A0A1I8PQR4_STOCA|nr:sugar transporter SWEET1 [Stomoxys calcitrans]XP_013101101.1 sugar transporter SWEET1 [Stomoxys calcitrans]XP_013101102.1 sugar transporter SWEET1 [Stomoxys calcitrans]XP_059222800.1 sugar transporter SWEET1 [Stomoxys calcitrans]XP_059222801.1 sugar transporter SWEET1 [Stomoxys calcitrans]